MPIGEEISMRNTRRISFHTYGQAHWTGNNLQARVQPQVTTSHAPVKQSTAQLPPQFSLKFAGNENCFVHLMVAPGLGCHAPEGLGRRAAGVRGAREGARHIAAGTRYRREGRRNHRSSAVPLTLLLVFWFHEHCTCSQSESHEEL